MTIWTGVDLKPTRRYRLSSFGVSYFLRISRHQGVHKGIEQWREGADLERGCSQGYCGGSKLRGCLTPSVSRIV